MRTPLKPETFLVYTLENFANYAAKLNQETAAYSAQHTPQSAIIAMALQLEVARILSQLEAAVYDRQN